MHILKNKFGEGTIYSQEDLLKTCRSKSNCLYLVSTACLSVTSDLISFVESLPCNIVKFIGKEFLSNFNNKELVIVVASCQVTDLAILNDIKTMDELKNRYPTSEIFCGGCLAYRFDIELPDFVKRLTTIRSEYTPITRYGIDKVDWKKPYWHVKEEDKFGIKNANLFRNHYPLKIGAGCDRKCKYCTINTTRGESYKTDAFLQIKEFLDNVDSKYYDGVVLVSDSPTVEQIQDWCFIADKYNKPISFRNVEPDIAIKTYDNLKGLAEKGLLDILHCPIQSNEPEVLKAMNRNVESTMDFIVKSQVLRALGVKVATNIIIDYIVDGQVVHNMPIEWLNAHFDSWVWNPYFDGKWNRENAEKRYQEYIL